MAAAKDIRVLHDDGNCYIPASQRADGSWRKPKKVKPGYIPQDEVPTYQSKGKIWADGNRDGLPVGMSKEMAESSAKAKKPQKLPSETRPTVKTSSINLVNKQLGQLSMKDDSGGAEISEKEKKIRQLKKKLKDIEELQGRIDRGELKNPEKNQLEKLSKRQELLDQLAQLDS